MTSSNSQDIPLATVNGFGLSEATSILVTIAGFLTAVFGQDWGVAKNAQAIAGLAFVLAPLAMGLARAIKHHGVANANAVVLAAQAAQAITTFGTELTPATPDPVTEPPVLPQPPAVGADLPVETVSTSLPADPPPASAAPAPAA